MEASDAEVILAKVVGGQTENGRVKGIELEGGRVVPCDVAVLCMGPWTGRRDHSVCFSWKCPEQGLTWWGLPGIGIGGNRAHRWDKPCRPDPTLGNPQRDLPSSAWPHRWCHCSLFIGLSREVQRPRGIIRKPLFERNYIGFSLSNQVYPRPDNTVYVCAGGSKDSLPVPQDPDKVRRILNSFKKRLLAFLLCYAHLWDACHLEALLKLKKRGMICRLNKTLTPLTRCCRWRSR